MTNTNLQNNTPHAAKFINSFRSNSHSTISAIQDLIDNSIDARAKNIQINIEYKNNDFEITIADNGTGMDWNTLIEANTLGSSVQKGISDLGKFGMGLITAGFSISKQIKIITYNNGEYLTSINDIDTIIEQNSFALELRNSLEEEIELFKKYNSTSTGTVIILSKSDRFLISGTNFENNNGLFDEFLYGTKAISGLLKSNASKEEGLVYKLGLTFRKFLRKDTKISVNGTQVKVIDPMFIDEGSTLIDSSYIDLLDLGIETKLKVSCYMLPFVLDAKSNEINQRNQGFYFLRNNRQIAQGEALGFTKHNDANRFRAEVEFNSELDELMGVDFQKSSINRINEEIKKRIVDFAAPHRTSIMNINKANKAVKVEKPTADMHDKVSKIIERKTGKKAEFSARDMGSSGSIFQADQLGKTLEIKLNSSHKFYELYYVENKNNDVKVLADLMIFSLANSQLHNADDRSVEIVDNFIESFSKNIRNIVSDIELK
jgi:hypothetical protein